MKVLQQSKNGIITSCLKTYEELTNEELQELRFASGTTKEDYANYQVHRNKKNEIIRVVTHEFSEKQKQEIEKNRGKGNIGDLCNLMFGKKQSKAYRKSLKKFTDDELDLIKQLNK